MSIFSDIPNTKKYRSSLSWFWRCMWTVVEAKV